MWIRALCACLFPMDTGRTFPLSLISTEMRVQAKVLPDAAISNKIDENRDSTKYENKYPHPIS